MRIATAPVNWGVLLKDTPGVPPWNEVLDGMAAAGYSGTELGPFGFLPLEPARLSAELSERGLELISAFVPLNLVDPRRRPDEAREAAEVIAFLGAMECEWVVLSDALFVDSVRAERAGRIRPEDGLDGDDWRRFVVNLEEFAGRAADRFGLRTVYHPHVGAWVEAPWEVDRLLEDSDPELVGLCLDTGHAAYGGDDPVELCRRWGDRVRYLHLKDCDRAVLERVRANEWDYFRAVEEGVFPLLGEGSVDFAALRDALDATTYAGWAVVEQDVLPGSGIDVVAAARHNREFCDRLGMD